MRRLRVLSLLILLLAACGKSAPPPAPAAAAPLPPAAPAIQKIFDTTCRGCHAVPASGAPQAGDTAAWAPRVAQGRDTLLNHTVNGFQRMPPMGMCTQCSEEDFTALIEYMSRARLN